jgi:hypothetical protein
VRIVRGYPRIAVIGLLGTGLIAAAVAAFPATADETTVSQNTYRTGWDQTETALSPADVASADFGQQFSAALDGQVYAQPLLADGTLIAATEKDNVYGLDPATGAVKWSYSLGPAWLASNIGCADLTPNLGITSTPVYDPATDYVYLVGKVDDGADKMHPHYYMHALNPVTGAEKPGFPVAIGGHPTNDVTATFDPASQGQRPGLLLLNGVVYAGFGSHCDYGTYRGYIAGVSTAGKQTTLWSDESGSSNNGAGIWGAGGGLTSDGSGQIIVATGNGVSPAPGPGKSPPGNLAESVIRLNVNSDGSLSPTDFFSPWDAPTMDANDTDFGSGGPMALPDSFGTASHPHLLVQMGKDGRLFLLDRDNLGGRSQGAGGTDAALGVLDRYQGQWGHPSFWGGDGGYVYLVGNGGPLRAFKYGVTGSGVPALTPDGKSESTFAYTSGSPVVTSNGTISGSAVVWIVWSSGPNGANAELRAYSPTPDANGTLALLWSSPIGTAVKFTTPATSNGRVYIGTRDGKVLAYGRPTTSVLTGSPAAIGDVAVGDTGTGTLTVTATKDLTVTAVAAASPFAATPPSLPYYLPSGSSVAIPVSFTPGAAGAASGTVTVTTNVGTVSFSATGKGTKPGLGASPPNLVFNDQPAGLARTQNIQVTNTGTSAETITGTSTPAAPFTVTGLPALGAQIPPGGSFIASVTYAPTGTGTDSSSISVTSGSDASRTLTIPLNGTAIVGQGHLQISPWPLDFGTVALGSTNTKTFSVTNTGNLPVTVTKAKAPNSDFTSASPLPEGQVIGPDQTYVQTVTYAPTANGAASASYEITSDDGQGARYVPISGSAVGTLPAVPTDWQLNGAATADAPTGTIQLTPATANLAGSAFSTLPVPTAGLAASFTARLNGGTGADGMTFALVDSAKGSPSGLGVAGGGLGFSGLPGIAVALDTFQNTQANSANFVGILAGPNNWSDSVTYLATAPVPAPLRTGTHKVTVTVNKGIISVFVDGARLLAYTPAAGVIPANAYAGFTAATGGNTDVHAVSNVTIASVPATAVGQALTASPATATIRYARVNAKSTTTVTLTNRGTATEVVTAVTGPTGTLAATLPPLGLMLPVGASVSVPVSFTPARLGAVTGSLSVTTTGGKVTVPINALTASRPIVVGPPHPVTVTGTASARWTRTSD